MTKKHFIFIADILRELRFVIPEQIWMNVVLAFANHLSRAFVRFDKDKFIYYCKKEK